MKYPSVIMKSIPYGFKHNEIAEIVVFEFKHEEDFMVGEDLVYKAAYVKFVKQELLSLFDSFMTINRPLILPYKDMSMVALKDNAEQYKVVQMLTKLLGEFKYYTKHKIDVEMFMMRAILLEEGKQPSMFKVNKVGDPIETQIELKVGALHIEDKFEESEISLITPYEEFVMRQKTEEQD